MWTQAVAAGFGVAVLLAMLVQSYETHQVVAGHNAELAQIKALAQETVHNQNTSLGTRTQEAADVKAIEAYAASLQTSVNGNHGQTYALLIEVCHSLPGCTIPPPTSAAGQ